MIPKRSIIKTTLVSLLKEKGSMNSHDVYEELAVMLNVTKIDLNIQLPKGGSKFELRGSMVKKRPC
jgi:hypothetical protein